MNHDEVQWIVKFAIEKERITEFKELTQEISKATESSEPGTRSYQWYINDEQTECVVSEWYVDSKAGIAHLKGSAVGQFLPKILNYSKIISFEVYGNPNEELEGIMKPFGVKIFHFFTGFTR